jgi:hypothetical protein
MTRADNPLTPELEDNPDEILRIRDNIVQAVSLHLQTIGPS